MKLPLRFSTRQETLVDYLEEHHFAYIPVTYIHVDESENVWVNVSGALHLEYPSSGAKIIRRNDGALNVIYSGSYKWTPQKLDPTKRYRSVSKWSTSENPDEADIWT